MFTDQYGTRIRITEKTEVPNQLAFVDEFIIGVAINGGVYPLLTRLRNQIIVRIRDGRNFLMTPELHALYDHFFTPYLRHPFFERFHH